MDEISKKELLVATGISYGQLYRWKREGLIPEEWFVKKSAFTGQETFFPREQALARVTTILAMKDSSSLEDIRKSLEYCERLKGEVLSTMLQRPDAARIATRDFSDREAGMEAWVLAAGIIEAGEEAGLSEEAIGGLVESALAERAAADVVSPAGAPQATGATYAAGASQTRGAIRTPGAPQTPGVTQTTGATRATGVPQVPGFIPAVQVSIVMAGETLHYITASIAVTLASDEGMRILATRQLPSYWDRARVQGAMGEAGTTGGLGMINDPGTTDGSGITNEKRSGS